MILLASILAPLLLGLAVLHMRKPRYEVRRISAARFFDDLAPTDSALTQWQWRNPLKSPPFLLQAACLILIGAAVFSENAVWYTVEEPGQRRLWVWVDTSSSMATRINDETMLDRVAAAWRDQNHRLEQQDYTWRFRLTAFDSTQRDFGEDLDAAGLSRGLAELGARPLATDVTLPLRALEQTETDGGLLLIYSDQPAPAWLAQLPRQRIVWHDVSTPVANHGFSAVQAVDNPFQESGALVQVSARQVGPAVNVRLDMRKRDGSWQDNQPITFKDGRFTTLFRPPTPGAYDLEIVPNDAYPADNYLVFQVPETLGFSVDWRHPNRDWLALLGWRHQAEGAVFSVVSPAQADSLPPDQPRLIVGPGFTSTPSRIGHFREGSPLLAQANLDVAETLGVAPVTTPAPLLPILADVDGRPWLARGAHPPAVYIAGFPHGQGDQARLTTLLWFNAVQNLLGSRATAPLFQTTDATTPSVETQTPPFRLDFHPAEGNSFKANQSYRRDLLDAPEAAEATATRAVAWWSWLIAAALLIFFAERVLFLIGGPAWR